MHEKEMIMHLYYGTGDERIIRCNETRIHENEEKIRKNKAKIHENEIKIQKINEEMRINVQQRLLLLLKIHLNDMKIARNNAIIAKLLAEKEAEKLNKQA